MKHAWGVRRPSPDDYPCVSPAEARSSHNIRLTCHWETKTRARAEYHRAGCVIESAGLSGRGPNLDGMFLRHLRVSARGIESKALPIEGDAVGETGTSYQGTRVGGFRDRSRARRATNRGDDAAQRCRQKNAPSDHDGVNVDVRVCVVPSKYVTRNSPDGAWGPVRPRSRPVGPWVGCVPAGSAPKSTARDDAGWVQGLRAIVIVRLTITTAT